MAVARSDNRLALAQACYFIQRKKQLMVFRPALALHDSCGVIQYMDGVCGSLLFRSYNAIFVAAR